MYSLQNYRNLLNQEKGKKQLLEKNLSDLLEGKKILKKRKIDIEKAQLFIQIVAKETQEKFRFHIEEIVQLALDSCFPGKYEFKIEFVIKRGKTEASLNFYENNKKIKPLLASGGGVVNIVCMALRMTAWSLGKTSPIIILDEPFPRLSIDLQPLAGSILREISTILGIQIIMITHNREIVSDFMDNLYEVFLKKNVSKVKRL